MTRDEKATTPGRSAPPALRAFIALFDREAFWDAHEALEDAWRTGRSEFYHGLILLASAFVHVQRHNRHGVLAQTAKARDCLEPYRPRYLGIDVDALLHEADAWDRLVRSQPHGDWVAMRPAPRIVVDPRHITGHEPELADGGEGE